MGQGSYHGIATLVLEELGARWDQTDVVGGVRQSEALRQSHGRRRLPVDRRLELHGLVLGSLPHCRRGGARDAGRGAADRMGRAGRRDHGGGWPDHASDRRQRKLRRACRGSRGDAGAGEAGAQGAGAVDPDRQRGTPPLRQRPEDQRHPALHHRREAPRHADRDHDPPAEVRRDGEILRRCGRESDARDRGRGGDAARPRRGGREHVGGDQGARRSHCGVGRGCCGDARLGGDPRGVPRARGGQAAGRRRAGGRHRVGDG